MSELLSERIAKLDMKSLQQSLDEAGKRKRITRVESFYWWNSVHGRKAEVMSSHWSKVKGLFSQLIIVLFQEYVGIIELHFAMVSAQLLRGLGTV